MKIWGVDFESRCGFASLKMKLEIKYDITIDNNYDRILEKRYKDGKKIQLTYDVVGNLIGKTRINGGTSTTIYTYNDQNQLSLVKEDGLTIASYSYDHKRQRVYSNSPGAQTYDGQKIYYWDTQGRIIWIGTTIVDLIRLSTIFLQPTLGVYTPINPLLLMTFYCPKL